LGVGKTRCIAQDRMALDVTGSNDVSCS